MKHRRLARFLTLSAACVVSLSLGAWLSYQAGERQETRLAQAAGPAVETGNPIAAEKPAAENPAAAAPKLAVQQASAQQDAAGLRGGLPAGRDSSPAIPAASPAAAPAMARRADDAAPQVLMQQSLMQQASLEVAPSPQAAAIDNAPQASAESQQPSALPELVPLPPADFGPGAQAPVPPRRPSSLSAAGTANTTSAPAASAAAAAAPATSGAFPAIADALAAMSASISGGNAELAPESGLAPSAQAAAEPQGFKKGAPVYVRIFKREGTLELWMKRGQSYALFKSFPVCKWSGRLGPKTRQADYQSPEGFYSVSARQLNPHSAYHLAFDVGYPNAYDRRQGSTGSAVMVHGDCKSVGCFAMTNRGIDEIYKYVAAALASGQKEVPVHIFPFRMTEQAIARESSGGNILAFLGDGVPSHDWSPFWHNLKQGYDLFETTHVPPVAYACGDRYAFGAAGRACSRIAGW